jgi:serine/threonine protein kinase
MEMEELPFKVKEFIFQKVIGEGSFGKIYMAQDENTFAFYAIKRIFKKIFTNSQIKQLFRDEVSITGTIYHKNIIHLYKMLESNDSFFLVFDYCEMGRLII